jgi:hypothetical protein
MVAEGLIMKDITGNVSGNPTSRCRDTKGTTKARGHEEMAACLLGVLSGGLFFTTASTIDPADMLQHLDEVGGRR